MAAQEIYALDLGSTRLKLARLSTDGRLTDLVAEPAPTLRGSGLIREADPAEFLAVASSLLDRIPEPRRARLGLVSQRSTFTVWNWRDAETLVPMISWQDRRADDWCEEHESVESELATITGLPLSAHYVGPKLAAMQAEVPDFRQQLTDPTTRVGTLDSWLIWNWTHGTKHVTDLTMAARTMLLDIDRGQWSSDALDLFGIPQAALPEVRDSSAQAIILDNGLSLRATIADQAAGMLAVLRQNERAALINFGTGAFVLCPTADAIVRRDGYLTGPVLGRDDRTEFAVEGTVNGAGPAVDRYGAGPIEWPESSDPSPNAFAIPDLSGLGSPHWRADVSLQFSEAGEMLGDNDKRRVVLEGLLFRVYEILLDLGEGKAPERIVISGGLTRYPAVAVGLARLIGQPVEVLVEPEATLLGTLRLAGNLEPYADARVDTVAPTAFGAYLPEKYPRWQAWLRGILAD